MLKVNIICIGNLKEAHWRGAVLEYSKRLNGICRFSVIELAEYKLPKDPGEAQIAQVLDKEGKQIIRRAGKSYCIALCIEADKMTSEDFAESLNKLSIDGVSEISFLIGSSYGLSEEVKEFADLKISLSDMTFSHQLARVILCEQIYRAFSINGAGKYHK